MKTISQRVAEELSVSESQVQAAILLLDEGATVPFIARYRKEGYPEKNGLAATTFFIRDNKDPKTCDLFDFWLNEQILKRRTGIDP